MHGSHLIANNPDTAKRNCLKNLERRSAYVKDDELLVRMSELTDQKLDPIKGAVEQLRVESVETKRAVEELQKESAGTKLLSLIFIAPKTTHFTSKSNNLRHRIF